MAEKAKTLADTLLPGLTGSANNWEDEYGYFHSEVSLFSGNTLLLTFDAAGDVTQIILNCSDTESWYNEKDLILQSSALGLDPDTIAPMLGKCSMTQFSGGVDVGGYTVTIVEVVAPVLNIRPNS